MSERYQRLGQDLPSQAGGGRFAADARKVKAWVAALPRANAAACEQALRDALADLAGQRLSGGARLAALEELRPAVVDSVALMERRFSANALPLPAELARTAVAAERFHQWMAHGYRQAVHEQCAPAGAVPFLRGGAVAQGLQRAAWHYARALALAWRGYRAPLAGTWQGLHRVYRFAASLKLEHKAVEDALAGSSLDVETITLQALLVSVANPYGHAQAEQDGLWPIARAYAARCRLLDRDPGRVAPVVPEDADRGPGTSAEEGTEPLWLDLTAFSQDVDQALARVRDGQAQLAAGPGLVVTMGNDQLFRLQRAFGLLAARRHERLPATHRLDSVVGLSALHFHLSGQRDFDTFMRQAAQGSVHVIDGAAWTLGGSGMGRAARFAAKVLDQSLGGYRVSWESAEQARARVGELIGVTFDEQDPEAQWMVGVMRWLRFEEAGGLSAGIELMSRRGSPVALRVSTADGGSRQLLRAVELAPMAPGEGRRFLTQAEIGANSRIEVIHDGASRAPELSARGPDLLGEVQVLLNAGDYLLLAEAVPAATAADGEAAADEARA